MKSPLTIYKEEAKRLGVTEKMYIPTVAQLNHVRSQVQEQQAILNRALTDLAYAKTHIENLKDTQTKSAYQTKINDFEADAVNMIDRLNIMLPLLKELDKEVGQASDNPTE